MSLKREEMKDCEEAIMIRRFGKTYVLTAVVLSALNWFLLWARFYWFGFGRATTWIYTVINFPCSILCLWLEKKPNMWWYEISGGRFKILFNDEIGGFLVFVITVLLQALLITALLLRLKGWWNKKQKNFVIEPKRR